MLQEVIKSQEIVEAFARHFYKLMVKRSNGNGFDDEREGKNYFKELDKLVKR